MVQQCANNDTATLIFCFEVSHCFAPFLLLSSCHRWYSSHCDLLWYSEVFSGIYCGIQWYSSPVLLWSTVVFRGHKEREGYEWLVVSSDYCRLRHRSDSSNVMSRQGGKGNECKTQTESILVIKNPHCIGCSLMEVRKSTHMSTIFSALCFLVDCLTQLISINK